MALGALVIVVVGVLLVNYFKGIDSGTTFPEAASIEESEPGTTVVTETGERIYKVKSGDTLWSIAEKQYQSGYNWVDLAEANGLESPSHIEEGQMLAVPNVESKTVTVKIESEEVAQPEASISGGTYTVVQGDSLWDIAVRKYNDGYKWVDIAAENELVNPNLIHTGNVLRLP